MYKYSNITIGNTISEMSLNKGIIKSDSIDKAYDLKLVDGLVGNQANFNEGTEDISKVFEIVKTYEQQMVDNQTNSL